MNTTSAFFTQWRKVTMGFLYIALLMFATQSLRAAQTATATATAYLADVPVPGIHCTNSSGQVYVKGNVHRLRMQADDARLTGRLQVTMDRGYLVDGTSQFGGAAYLEVGAWDLVDPLSPKFQPTRGVWDMLYQGVTQVDGSDLSHWKGYGIGGVIEGQILEVTMTRGPGDPLDPSVPCQANATIKAAPQDNLRVVDNFDDNRITGWQAESSNGRGTITEKSEQLTVRGYWPEPGVPESNVWAKGWVRLGWSVDDGKTLEWRVDVIRMSPSTSMADPGPWSQSRGLGYVISFGPGFVGILKYMGGIDWAALFCEKAAIKSSNVVLALAMTRTGTNLVLTVRVLDRDNRNAVLFERNVVDTPAIDPTLTTSQWQAVTGLRLPVLLVKDRKETPVFSGDAYSLEMMQFDHVPDPEAEVVYDNVELRTYDVPQVAVERTARLSWASPGGENYGVQGGPTLEGPWLPVQTLDIPGIQTVTVPVDTAARFFQLRPAP